MPEPKTDESGQTSWAAIWRVVQTVAGGLLIAAVLGLFALQNRITRLEERFTPVDKGVKELQTKQISGLNVENVINSMSARTITLENKVDILSEDSAQLRAISNMEEEQGKDIVALRERVAKLEVLVSQ